MKKFFSLVLFVFALFIVSPASAVYFGSGENLVFPKTQSFNETVFLAGSSLVIDSDIVGDLYCTGQDITINSKVAGDIICAGQNIEINGPVEGNVRLVSQNIDLNSSIAKNVTVASQNLQIGKASVIKGDVFYGAQNIDLNGVIGRDLSGGSESITISGSLLRNAKIGTSKLSITDSANLGGNLEYYIEKSGTTSINEKSIKGKVTRHEVVIEQKDQFKKDLQKLTPAILVFKAIVSTLSSVLLAFLLLYFIPGRVAKVTKIIKLHPVKSALIGLAVLITGPIAIIIFCITIVGLGLGAVFALFYFLSLILASSFVAVRVGELLVNNYENLKKSVYLSTLISCLLLGLIVHIPVLGGAVGFIIFLVGLGASFLSYFPDEV